MKKSEHAAATRDDIVLASIRLFARRGFHNASIAEISSAAGITKGAIYWHFDSKQALFDAILDRIKADWQRTVMAGVDEATDPREKLSRLFDNYLVLFTEESEVCLFLQRILLELDEPNSQVVAKVFERTARYVAGIIESGQRQGAFAADADAQLVAATLLGSLSGATGQCAANKRLRLGAMIGELKAQVLDRLAT